MPRALILHPSREMIEKWGILAHVDDIERNRILNLPCGQFQREKKLLAKEVDLAKFPRRKKSNVSESWYNSNRSKVVAENFHEEEKDIDSY